MRGKGELMVSTNNHKFSFLHTEKLSTTELGKG